MENLIKTVLGEESEEYLKFIEDLLSDERKTILSEQEKKMIEYLKEVYEEAGKFPTENYFLEQFPEYSVPLSSAENLDFHDLEIHYKMMVSKRNRQIISREIMRAASIVSEEGFTDEIKDKIDRIFKLNREVELDKSVFEIGQIRKIYQKMKEEPIGLQTFIPEIDEKIGGLNYGTVNVFFGFTGAFKTTTVTNIAYRNVYDLGYNVAFISLEVPKRDIIFNVLSRHSFNTKFAEYPYIGHDDIRKMEIDEEKEEYVFDTVLTDFEEESEGELVILDETDFKAFTFPDIRKRLEEVDDRLEGGLDAVIWDHANLFKFSGKKGSYMSQYDIINEYVSFIRGLSIKWRKKEEEDKEDEGEEYRQLCNIIVAQANRQGYLKAKKNGGRYNLTAIAEANELERSAYRIFSTYTDDELKQSKELKMQLLKNRSGPTIYEPITVFVEPDAYVVGEEMEGFSETLDTNDLDDVFGGDDLGI